jgi:hypothetical protein
MSVPFLVLVFAARVSPRFPVFTFEPNQSSLDLGVIFGSPDWDTFCFSYEPLDKILIQYIIIMVYATRVVPLVYATFYDTVGDSPKVVSKLNSVRILTFQQVRQYMCVCCILV